MRKNWQFKPHEPFRAAVLIAVITCLLYAGCGQKTPAPNPQLGRATQTFLSPTYISPNAQKIVYATDTEVRCWDTATKTWQDRAADLANIAGLSPLPDTKQIVTCSYRDKSSSLEFQAWDLAALTPMRSTRVPHGIPAGGTTWCFVTQDTVAIACRKNVLAAEDNMPHIVLWRLAGDMAIEQREIALPWRAFSVECMFSVGDNQIWLVVEPRSDTPLEPPPGTMTPPQEWKPSRALPTELVLCNCNTGQILNHMRLPEHKGLAVSDDGKVLAMRTLHKLEMRSLPLFQLLKEVDISVSPSPSSCFMELSKEKRLVAFGRSRLELWNTATNNVCVLDKLQEGIVDNPGFKAFTPPGDVAAAIRAYNQYNLADMRFINEDQWLVAVTQDGIFMIYDVATQKCIRRERIAEVQNLGNFLHDPSATSQK